MANKSISDSYKKKASQKVINNGSNVDKLKSSLKFGPDNVVQGIIYSEIFGRPKGSSRMRNQK